MPSAPYDSLEAVANTARVRLNDAIQVIGGEIFTDTAAFSLTVVNAAWRRLQEMLADLGYAALTRETVLAAVPANVSADPGVFVWFNWANYFNGGSTAGAPVLPQDLITPLDLFERLAGSGSFLPMDQVLNGLPAVPKAALNYLWEWRGETIYLPGTTGTTDIRLRYAAFQPDFVAAATTPWSAQPVTIMRVLNPFAWLMCSEVAKARGDMDAGYFDQQAMMAAQMTFNRDQRQGKALYKRSELGKMPDANTPGKAGQ